MARCRSEESRSLMSKNEWKIGCVTSIWTKRRFRHHPFHLLLEVEPVVVTEVVEDDEAALEQVRAQPGRFGVAERTRSPGSDMYADRVVHQFRVVEREDVRPVDVRRRRRQVVERSSSGGCRRSGSRAPTAARGRRRGGRRTRRSRWHSEAGRTPACRRSRCCRCV